MKNPNVRRLDESFKAYKERRQEENKRLRIRLRGRIIWGAHQGTYIRKKHGAL